MVSNTMMIRNHITIDTEILTEERLAEDFSRVQDEIAEQIRKYETECPRLNPELGNDAEEFVHVPVYTYEIHAAS